MLEKQLQLEHLLPDLGCHALEELSDLPGSLPVQRNIPPAPPLTVPAEPPSNRVLHLMSRTVQRSCYASNLMP